MKVGFCGAGRMAVPMIQRLLKHGHEVTVWNRTRSKLEGLVQAGAGVASTPAEVAGHAEIVCLCLLNGSAVEDVVFGKAGIAEGNKVEIVIDHSSIRPDSTRAFAYRLREATAAAWVDAPVSGGTEGAKTGTLAIMAGGSSADVSRVREVMTAYAARITRMGETGAGQATKLCNQTIVASTIVAIAEAVALANANGLEAALLPQALEGGWADSMLLRMFVPRMLGPPNNVIGTLDTMLKDLDAVSDLALQSDTQIPVGSAAHQIFSNACALGLGKDDISAIYRMMQQRPLAP
jgi:2-hydroxy-3-oxopropionate reductase